MTNVDSTISTVDRGMGTLVNATMPKRHASASRKPALAWWVAPLLALPALIPLGRACVVPYLQGKVATGFIIYDMPSYVAYGREHFDEGFRLTWGNPYGPYGTPALYFQPHVFVLGFLVKLGLRPGLAFNLFGLAALFFAAWAGVRLYEEVVGLESTAKILGLVCFFWGGGILSAAGVLAGLFQHRSALESLLQFDIGGGWWMFNFGRNLTYPTEAFFHALFFLSVLCLMRRRYAASLAFAALLSLSHAFTGTPLLLILVTYSLMESIVNSQAVNRLFLIGSVVLLALHLGYYMVFLNRFPEHRMLQDAYERPWLHSLSTLDDWLYKPSTYVPVLLIVAALAVVRLLRRPGLREQLKEPRVRLFILWFLVVFALTQHNLFMKPSQPVHFAHGYDWTALFFLGVPVMISLFDRLLRIRPWQLRYAALGAVIALFLLDNLIWYASFFSPARKSQAIVLTKDEKSLLDWLGQNTAPPEMVVCQDRMLSYLVSTYTSVRSWVGHMHNTPFIRQRRAEVERAFLNGDILPEWEHMHVIYVARRDAKWTPPPGTARLYNNNEFVVWGRR